MPRREYGLLNSATDILFSQTRWRREREYSAGHFGR
jgi:hypothetical protein